MTDQKQAPERRVTFNNETPETSDVVLCDYCGSTLHAPEDDIFWEMTANHNCEKMLKAEIEDLTKQRDELAESLASTVESRNRWMDAVQRVKTERDELTEARDSWQREFEHHAQLYWIAIEANRKVEAERDELKQELFTFTNSVRKRERELRVQLDQALAASAAREITRLRALAEQENNNG